MYLKQPPPSFTYLISQHTTNPNPDPNAYSPYPQRPLQLAAEPALHAPGTDPYANHPPLTHLGCETTQTHFYEDPNASWVTRHAAPIRYDPGSLASTSVNTAGNSYWANQPLMNSVLKQSKVIQPMRCAVCKIDCNSQDVYEKHISGKKHQRNMQTQLNSTAVALQNSYGTVNHTSMVSGASSVAAAQELEKKKQKLLSSGTAADSVRICTICNVACNGEDVFLKHLSGKKHAAQATLRSLGGGVGQCFAEIKAQNNSVWGAGGHKKTKVVQSAWCEVCKINCNSNDVYVKHLQGKKHQKNLENLEKAKSGAITVASSSAVTPGANLIGPVENPEADKSTGTDSQKKRTTQSQSTVDDLETKKRKVVESGAAAADVRICTVCNVVCNSQTVFDSHITGQKHAAMVKKQAQGLTESAAPQVVCAT